MTQAILDLSKDFELDLQKAGFTQIPVLRTRLAIDQSGSMDTLYRKGFVNTLVELFLGAALKFDDNGELEYSFFTTRATSMKTIDLNGYGSFKLPEADGGTNYTPVLKELFDLDKPATGLKSLFGFGGSKASNSEPPVYVGFVTDGQPGDESDVLDFLRENESSRNFVQVIVLGSSSVNAGLRARLEAFKNVALTVIPNPSNMTTEELYTAMANQKLLTWTDSVK